LPIVRAHTDASAATPERKQSKFAIFVSQRQLSSQHDPPAPSIPARRAEFPLRRICLDRLSEQVKLSPRCGLFLPSTQVFWPEHDPMGVVGEASQTGALTTSNWFT
jgi:hypothetical protein